VTGFSAALLLNLFEWLIQDQPGAMPLSDDWWTSWFPSYPFWAVFLLVGFMGRRRVMENPLGREEVEGSRAEDPVAKQFIFDRVFKIYTAKYGKELDAQIIQAMKASLRSEDEAIKLFEECESLGNDARHFMRLKVFGQINESTVRMELMKEHPDLSVQSLDRAMEFGEEQVPKD